MRRYNVTVYGNSAAELEAEAFRKARAVFGPQVGLAIDRSYGIFENSSYSDAPEGTTLHASMDVHPQEPLTGNEWYLGKFGGYGSESWTEEQHTKAYDDKYGSLDFGSLAY